MKFKVRRTYLTEVEIPDEDIKNGAHDYWNTIGYDDFDEAEDDWIFDNISIYTPLVSYDDEIIEYDFFKQ